MGLCTLANVKDELKAPTTQAADDLRLLGYIDSLTRRFDKIGGMLLQPRIYTIKITVTSMNTNVSAGTLTLPDMLLEPQTITSSGQPLVYGTDVLAEPYGIFPIRTLRLSDTSGLCSTWYPTGTPIRDTVVITGFFGYRDFYDLDGWITSTDSIQTPGGISATTTSITVTDVDGVDLYNMAPRFSPGNLLRIEDEMLEVRAVNTTTNILTVMRGVRGSTAATHAQSTTIYNWNAPLDLVGACARSVAARYARRGAYEQVTVSDIATSVFPRDLLSEVYDVISEYGNE